MFDAYAIKKIAPRILAAIILINLSIYLVAAASEATRVIANGVSGIITQPFVEADEYNFELGEGIGVGKQAVAGAGIVAGGYFLASRSGTENARGITRIVSGIFGRGENNTRLDSNTRRGNQNSAIHTLVWLVIIPVALIVFAIFITLVFRQGLLLLLAMSAPIACALYILPSTEKYFKKWWELFSKTLLMYPIIMVIFALSDVLASIIFSNNSSGSLSAILAGLIAMFAPLALVPYSFKLAGGAMGAIAGALTNGRGKLGEMGFYKENKEKARTNWQKNKVSANTTARARAIGRENDRVKRIDELERKIASHSATPSELAEHKSLTAGWRSRQGRRGARDRHAVGSLQKYLKQEAELNKQTAEEQQLITNFGNDDEQRAATATLQDVDVKDAAGNVIGTRKAWLSLNGKEYSEATVMAARRATGSDQFKTQQMMAYEMSKSLTEQDHDSLIKNLPGLQKSLGLTDEEMTGALIGAGFQMKGKTLQWKRLTTKTDQTTGEVKLTFDGKNMIEEQHASTGTYAGMSQDADNFRTLTMLAVEAEAMPTATPEQVRNKEDRIAKIKEIAEGMKSQIAQAGGTTAAYQLAMQQTGQEATPGGSAAATEAIDDFIKIASTLDVAGPKMPTAADFDQPALQQEFSRLYAAKNPNQPPGTYARLDPATQSNFISSLVPAEINGARTAAATTAQRMAMDTIHEIANIENAAREKKKKRNYGKIDL